MPTGCRRWVHSPTTLARAIVWIYSLLMNAWFKRITRYTHYPYTCITFTAGIPQHRFLCPPNSQRNEIHCWHESKKWCSITDASTIYSFIEWKTRLILKSCYVVQLETIPIMNLSLLIIVLFAVNPPRFGNKKCPSCDGASMQSVRLWTYERCLYWASLQEKKWWKK